MAFTRLVITLRTQERVRRTARLRYKSSRYHRYRLRFAPCQPAQRTHSYARLTAESRLKLESPEGPQPQLRFRENQILTSRFYRSPLMTLLTVE